MSGSVERSVNSTRAGQPVDRDTHFDIERFLTREARLLDQERFDEWLQLLTADIRYQLPVEEVRYREDTKPIGSATGNFIYDDDYALLEMRVKRTDTGLIWFENPRTSSRRLITNIDAEWSEQEDEVNVYSTFLTYRNRRQSDETWLVGGREDRLRRTAAGWRLAHRLIRIDQRVIQDKNLHLFL